LEVGAPDCFLNVREERRRVVAAGSRVRSAHVVLVEIFFFFPFFHFLHLKAKQESKKVRGGASMTATVGGYRAGWAWSKLLLLLCLGMLFGGVGHGPRSVTVDALAIVSPASHGRSIQAVAAAFGSPLLRLTEAKGNVIQAVPFDGCTDFLNSGDFAGNIVLVLRGGCTFREKATSIEVAGAIGVVVVNNVRGDNAHQERDELFMMSDDSKSVPVRIPAEMISLTDGKDILNMLNAGKKVVATMGTKVDFPSDYYYV
jgi:hypothetical protein